MIAVVTCEFDANMKLKIVLAQVNRATGLFKVSVENLKNPPSLRGSSPLTNVFQKTNDGKVIAQFTGVVEIETDGASEILNLTPANIDQTSQNYGDPAEYTIKFKPNSVVKTSPLSIVLQYPTTISPVFKNNGVPSEDGITCEILTSG